MSNPVTNAPVTRTPWYRSKTNWTCIFGGLAAGAAYATGDIDAATAVQSGVGALIGIFLRQGVEKSGPTQ